MCIRDSCSCSRCWRCSWWSCCVCCGGNDVTRSALWRRIKRDYGPYLPLSPYLLVVIFPFYWMVITTFKRDNDLYNLTGAPFWFKESPTLSHVNLLLYDTLFLTWLKNSLFIGASVVVITLVLGLPAAYALARFRFPGNHALSTAMFLSYLCLLYTSDAADERSSVD